MDKLVVSDDKALLDQHRIYDFLTHQSTWAMGISLSVVQKSIQHSICIGAYLDGLQVGFCRVITDQATFANLVDVMVWPEYRGMGISHRLMEAVSEHPALQGVRRFTLATSDAHGLYQKYGFTALHKPQTFMEIYRPDIYQRDTRETA
ncbi:GNAT family N-acetyltransferase [Bowmanella denitrificans]|uniref:GNAT family N-acetyltransferase n=1 Tax=Bowmanella denitrificans TaxID=366582 RepID=A0ABP3GFX8_9ALTE